MANQVRFGADQESYDAGSKRLQLKDLLRQGSNPSRSPKLSGKGSQTAKTTKVSKKALKAPAMKSMPKAKVY